MSDTTVRVTLDATHERIDVYNNYPHRRVTRASQVSVGAFVEVRSTLTEAKAALADSITRYAEVASTRPIIETFRGRTSIATVIPDRLSGWAWSTQDITQVGAVIGGGVGEAGATPELVRARTRYNLAQITTDWSDDVSVRAAYEYVMGGDLPSGQYGRDFLDYAGFQRAAIKAMAANVPDWHGWAHAHRAEHAPSFA